MSTTLRVAYKQASVAIPDRLFEKCEHAWSYLGKIVIIVRQSLNAAAKNSRIVTLLGKDFPDRVKYIATRMKLCSIVGVPFSCSALKGTVQKIFNSMKLKDREGVALSMLSFTILSMDIFDSITTFVNAALETAARQPIQAFSSLGLPVAYGLTFLSTVSRTISIAKTCNLYKSLQNEAAKEENMKALKSFLENKFELTKEEKKLISSPEERDLVITRKHAEILRAAPAEVVAELKVLYALLKQDKPNLKMVSQSLDHIQAMLRKKMKIDALGIGANLVAVPALCLFSLGAVTATPFILIAVSFLIRLSAVVYQDQQLK